MEADDQHQRVREVLSSAVASLCQKVLRFQSGIRVEGLLGITVDTKNIVLVNILEDVAGPGGESEPEASLLDGKELEINADNAAFLEKLLSQPKDEDAVTSQFITEAWNDDVKVPENVLSELLDKVQADKCDLFASDDQPKKSKSKKKKKKKKTDDDVPIKEELPNPATDPLKCLSQGQVSMDGLPLLGCEENSRDKGFSPSLRHFGEGDTLLSMNQDDNSMDCFPPSLASPSELDCNGHLDMDDGSLKMTSDLYHKDILDTSSVKEETNERFTLGKDPEHSLSNFIPSILETDITDTSSLNNDGEKYPCGFCGAVFSHKRSMWRHQRKHKGANTNWTCDICSQTFSRKDILMRHKQHHNKKKDKGGQCPFCEKTFSRMDSMQRHISINHNDKLSSELPPLGVMTGAL